MKCETCGNEMKFCGLKKENDGSYKDNHWECDVCGEKKNIEIDPAIIKEFNE